MYRIFAFGKRLWVAMGMPMAPLVRHVRHRMLAKYWPVKPPQSTPAIQAHSSTPTVSVILPTDGKDIHRLERCISALYDASEGVHIHLILVVAPSTPSLEWKMHARFKLRATLVFCTTFQYSHSLNLGLEHIGEADYVLFLHDDCLFTGAQSLRQLVYSLQQKQWACIGPQVCDTEGNTDGTEPLPGMCILWDAQWINRLGCFDTNYGYDETHYSWRARNLGARWGRENSVTVVHPNTALATPNKQWQPLPGIQVVLAGHNVSPWLQRALDSIEKTMAGFHWILVFADDASTDDTLQIIQRHNTSATQKVVRSFPKARGAAEAKNRAISLGTPYAEEYPILCLMDCDDVMLPARMQVLLPYMHDHNASVVFGAYEVLSLKGYTKLQMPDSNMQTSGEYLHPCSTLIHRSLVPADGSLFDPTLTHREDEVLWQQWKQAGIHMEPVSGPPVYRYIERRNSVMRPE